VLRLWRPVGTVTKADGDSNSWLVGGPRLSPLQSPVPVGIELDNDLFFGATALPRFIGEVLCDKRGVYALIYRSIDSAPATTKSTEKAIAALESGALRASAVTDLAVDLRRDKHVDPVLGVISAYLYDSIGDVANIRRMAYYYISYSQPVPYDIALLAQLKAERRNGSLWVTVPAVGQSQPRTKAEKSHDWTYAATSEKKGMVGGWWPWMRQGWTFLDDSLAAGSKLVSPGLIGLREYLQPARFATFDARGKTICAELFGLTAGASDNFGVKKKMTSRNTSLSSGKTKRPALKSEKRTAKRQ
jgi:hypothetical protein